MKLAILHYHLNRGGVTRVIENQLAALDAVLAPGDPWPTALIYGGRREGWNERLPATLRNVRLRLHEVPAIDYDQRGGSAAVGRQLAGALRQIGFTPQQSVLHVHNHALGKNVALPGAMARLAAEGFALVLQTHDFPEDLRPANYRRICDAGIRRGLYPQAPQIHYAVLNGRDHRVLRESGVAGARLHLLPNSAPPRSRSLPSEAVRAKLAQRFGISASQRLVLYPVRGIRRKNLGEALLYAALAPPDRTIGLTLPPLNPAEGPLYQGWKKLAAELGLACRFELGAPGGLSLAENLAAAEMICTTSVAEGFGMVFLESWQAGRPLVGRDLPEITRDLTQRGIRLDWLKPQLRVPVEWVGADRFRRTIVQAYRQTLRAYGHEEPEDLSALLDARTEDGLVDFADLDESLQQRVLRIVCRGGENRRCVLRWNPWIEQALSLRREEVTDVIEANARAVQEHFSLVASGRRLLDLYRQVAASRRAGTLEPPPDGRRILQAFLDFRRFRPIRGCLSRRGGSDPD